MNHAARNRFDTMVDAVVGSLPPRILAMLDSAPLIVEDLPSDEVLRSLGIPPGEADTLCGLHDGTMATERSISDPFELPSTITIYREGIVAEAGGWGDAAEVERQIRITILHELGHEHGLDEDDLDELGFA